MQSFRVNGYDMAYLEVGEGHPLVCVHGTLGDFRTWYSVLGPLSTRHRVIAVSLRHFFPEHWDAVGDDYKMAQHVSDVTAFIEQRTDVNAVVHAHPTYCTILAIMGMEIPPVHYMIAAAGGDSIRCAPYATFGTVELSGHAVRALEGRLACLLDHHGMIAIGQTLDKAMWLAVEVETLARQYHGCLQIGKPPLLSSDEIERVRQRMAGYGLSEG